MDDATIRDENNLLYTNPDNPYALPISILPEGKLTSVRSGYISHSILESFICRKAYNQSFRRYAVNHLKRMQNYFQGMGMQYTMGEIPSYVYEFFKKGIESGESYYGLNHTTTRSEAGFATQLILMMDVIQ